MLRCWGKELKPNVLFILKKIQNTKNMKTSQKKQNVSELILSDEWRVDVNLACLEVKILVITNGS